MQKIRRLLLIFRCAISSSGVMKRSEVIIEFYCRSNIDISRLNTNVCYSANGPLKPAGLAESWRPVEKNTSCKLYFCK